MLQRIGSATSSAAPYKQRNTGKELQHFTADYFTQDIIRNNNKSNDEY